MIKKLKILLILILIIKSGFCQIGYPRKIVLNNDTVIAIIPEQLKKINVSLVERDKYFELNNNLLDQIKLQEGIRQDSDELLRNCSAQKDILNKEIIILNNTIENKDKTISLKDKKIRFFKGTIVIEAVIFSVLLFKCL